MVLYFEIRHVCVLPMSVSLYVMILLSYSLLHNLPVDTVQFNYPALIDGNDSLPLSHPPLIRTHCQRNSSQMRRLGVGCDAYVVVVNICNYLFLISTSIYCI